MYSLKSMLFCYILQYILSSSDKYFQKSVTKGYITILYPQKPAHHQNDIHNDICNDIH